MARSNIWRYMCPVNGCTKSYSRAEYVRRHINIWHRTPVDNISIPRRPIGDLTNAVVHDQVGIETCGLQCDISQQQENKTTSTTNENYEHSVTTLPNDRPNSNTIKNSVTSEESPISSTEKLVIDPKLREIRPTSIIVDGYDESILEMQASTETIDINLQQNPSPIPLNGGPKPKKVDSVSSVKRTRKPMPGLTSTPTHQRATELRREARRISPTLFAEHRSKEDAMESLASTVQMQDRIIRKLRDDLEESVKENAMLRKSITNVRLALSTYTGSPFL